MYKINILYFDQSNYCNNIEHTKVDGNQCMDTFGNTPFRNVHHKTIDT